MISRMLYQVREAYGETAAESAWAAVGKSRKKVVPWPTVLSTEIRPLFRSTIWRTMNNPRPVPFPGSFVVKVE